MFHFNFLSFGSFDREELHLKDQRRIRFDVAARSPLTLTNIGREGREKKRGGISPSPIENLLHSYGVVMGNGLASTQVDDPPAPFARIR
jgi:hypothetical protein